MWLLAGATFGDPVTQFIAVEKIIAAEHKSRGRSLSNSSKATQSPGADRALSRAAMLARTLRGRPASSQTISI
jgi:hypothetical protein